MPKIVLYRLLCAISITIFPGALYAAPDEPSSLSAQRNNWYCVVLAALVLIRVSAFMAVRLNALLRLLYKKKSRKSLDALRDDILNMNDNQLYELLMERKAALQFRLGGRELSGEKSPEDIRGLIKNVSTGEYIPMVEEKSLLNFSKRQILS